MTSREEEHAIIGDMITDLLRMQSDLTEVRNCIEEMGLGEPETNAYGRADGGIEDIMAFLKEAQGERQQ